MSGRDRPAGKNTTRASELDERLEAVPPARTVNQLAVLTVDLPSVSGAVGGVDAAAKDVVRFEGVHSGAVTRAGRWVVPRRLELAVTYCAVTLDFTEAVITQDTVLIDVGTMAVRRSRCGWSWSGRRPMAG
ncbi:hypothetical protein [Streptomyces sp. SID13726]|uniref:hypothetical protein n=1 Tax=Streptomyces sp. SID13726 TaxID=2706058 RepID=UPI001EF27902|nr:hypothetical protein [Streptomyces sp. SID13726]